MPLSPSSPNAAAAEPMPDTLAEVNRIQSELEGLQEALAESQRLSTLGTLASILAHEYNNLLTPIVSYTQLALSRPNDHELAAKALRRAHDAARQAAAISESVLGLAREQGAESAAAALPEAIDAALHCLARPLMKDGIELDRDVPAVSAKMRPIELQQVLLNLILNARKAMGGQGGKLMIRARASGGVVRIDVADTGPGVPAAIRDRLFEPFVTQAEGGARQRQGDEAAGKQQGGSGLGLCVCRHLVGKAGGRIWCESEPGQGARFKVELPAAEGERSSQTHMDRPANAAA